MRTEPSIVAALKLVLRVLGEGPFVCLVGLAILWLSAHIDDGASAEPA